jgi:HD superfamily phosphodiesterase
MKTRFQKIWDAARPYLETRKNIIHTEVSIGCAYRLMEKEGGDEDVVIPAVMLHDVGWIRVPENLQLEAFGPKAASKGPDHVHEIEGVKIAKEILEQLHYNEDLIKEILVIIEGHDSRDVALSQNDRIVKDADKLWRYLKEGFWIDKERFGETFEERFGSLRENLERWFFTQHAKEIARAELLERLGERGRKPGTLGRDFL